MTSEHRLRLVEVVRICESLHKEHQRYADPQYVNRLIGEIDDKIASLRAEAEKIRERHSIATDQEAMQSSLSGIAEAKRKLREFDNRDAIARLKKLNDKVKATS